MRRTIKVLLSASLAGVLRLAAPLFTDFGRLLAHARLAAKLSSRLSPSVILLGPARVYGTGNIRIGENVLFYPDVHLETQGNAWITIGDGVVLSRGVHLVAMSGITIGPGTLIGEYSGIRDANHQRQEGVAVREAGHTAKAITLGGEVWIGRGVTILGGVHIGEKATVGANAVVTKDVVSGSTVAGVPAEALFSRRAVASR